MEVIMRIKTLVLLLLLAVAGVYAQDNEGKLVLYLEDAQQYALQHNKMIRASSIDVQASKMATWEAISAGLPKVDGSASLTDNLKIMTIWLLNSILDL